MARRKIATVQNEYAKALVQLDSEWQEYRVRLYVAGVLQPDADYHTDDRTDAVCTANAMINRAADAAFSAATC